MISYNASISACEKNGLWQLSLVLLEEALQSQLEVTAVSFSAAIGACERAGVMQRANARDDDQKMMADRSTDVVSFLDMVLTCREYLERQMGCP